MREASVVGFMPSSSAVPSGPKIFPPGLFQRNRDAVPLLALEFVARQQRGVGRRSPGCVGGRRLGQLEAQRASSRKDDKNRNPELRHQAEEDRLRQEV